MRRLLASSALVLALLAAALPARAQDPGVEQLKGRFAPQEQILLSGLLADPRAAGEFAADGRGDQAVFESKWRARLASYSQDYLAKNHPLNEKASSLKEAVEPGQWGMLMATLRALKKSDSWADQAKLKIFLGMIEDADDGLKAGDPRAARKVQGTAAPKLSEAMTEYLGSAAARQAVADQKKRDDAARAEQERLAQLSKDDAGRAQLAREEQARKEQAAKDEAARAEQARQDQARRDQAAARDQAAKKQLENADRAAQNGGDLSRTFDGAVTGGPPPLSVTPADGTGGGAGGSGGSAASRLGGPTVPTLTVKPGPPSPSVGPDDDMAELRSMKKEAQDKTGWRKWAAAGAGAVLGGLLGFLLGGPIGAVIGAALGGGGAFLGAKHFWA